VPDGDGYVLCDECRLSTLPRSDDVIVDGNARIAAVQRIPCRHIQSVLDYAAALNVTFTTQTSKVCVQCADCNVRIYLSSERID
jgi:hypothetical protein